MEFCNCEARNVSYIIWNFERIVSELYLYWVGLLSGFFTFQFLFLLLAGMIVYRKLGIFCFVLWLLLIVDGYRVKIEIVLLI